MMNKLTDSEFQYIISRIIDNANDSFEDKSDDDFTQGKKLAYYEILDTVKNELLARDIDVSQFGLDIDLNKLV